MHDVVGEITILVQLLSPQSLRNMLKSYTIVQCVDHLSLYAC